MKINVNKTIVVNGQKYASPEEMPEELRRAYQAAMGSGGLGHLTAASGVKTRISFNGKEFASVDTMPPDLRKLYDLAMAAADTEAAPSPEKLAGPAASQGVVEKDGVFVKLPAAPESSKKQISSQLLQPALVALGLAVLAALVVFLRR